MKQIPHEDHESAVGQHPIRLQQRLAIHRASRQIAGQPRSGGHDNKPGSDQPLGQARPFGTEINAKNLKGFHFKKSSNGNSPLNTNPHQNG